MLNDGGQCGRLRINVPVILSSPLYASNATGCGVTTHYRLARDIIFFTLQLGYINFKAKMA